MTSTGGKHIWSVGTPPCPLNHRRYCAASYPVTQMIAPPGSGNVPAPALWGLLAPQLLVHFPQGGRLPPSQLARLRPLPAVTQQPVDGPMHARVSIAAIPLQQLRHQLRPQLGRDLLGGVL